MMDGTLASQVMMSVIARKYEEIARERERGPRGLGDAEEKVKSDRFLPLKVKAQRRRRRSELKSEVRAI